VLVKTAGLKLTGLTAAFYSLPELPFSVVLESQRKMGYSRKQQGLNLARSL